MDFELIGPRTLRKYWPQIRAGLELMPADDWIPEDVYSEVRSGAAVMHVVTEQDEFLGFIAFQARETEFSRLPVLHVWLAYNAAGIDVIEAGSDLIQQTAKRLNASKITFASPRKGWAKRYPLITATYEIPQ